MAKAITAKTEAELLQVINSGLSAEAGDEYHALFEKRQAEALTSDEHARLIEISDHLEWLSIQRLQALLQLAELRGDSLQNVMGTLPARVTRTGLNSQQKHKTFRKASPAGRTVY